jgi:hypothetical protein
MSGRVGWRTKYEVQSTKYTLFMVPEISHRCPSCGASVRDRDALFCPECGESLAEKSAKAETGGRIEATNPSMGEQPRKDSRNAYEPSVVREPPHALPETSDAATVSEASPAAVETNEDTSAQPAHRRGDKTRERLHRASEVARGVTRGVIEEPAKRVEKIRQASNVVIEEASYDPSLRFVLVALILFVVFMVLLILSKVMG